MIMFVPEHRRRSVRFARVAFEDAQVCGQRRDQVVHLRHRDFSPEEPPMPSLQSCTISTAFPARTTEMRSARRPVVRSSPRSSPAPGSFGQPGPSARPTTSGTAVLVPNGPRAGNPELHAPVAASGEGQRGARTRRRRRRSASLGAPARPVAPGPVGDRPPPALEVRGAVRRQVRHDVPRPYGRSSAGVRAPFFRAAAGP